MRTGSTRRFAPNVKPEGSLDYAGWLQAGFFGFAYWLAHLVLPRASLVLGLSLVFLLA